MPNTHQLNHKRSPLSQLEAAKKNYDSFGFPWSLFGFSFFLLVLVLILIIYLGEKSPFHSLPFDAQLVTLLFVLTPIAFISSLLIVLPYYFNKKRKLRNNITFEVDRANCYSNDVAVTDAQSYFSKLEKTNLITLEKLYISSQWQVDRSFMFVSVAAALGFCLILLGVGLHLLDKADAATTTAISGTISECFSAIVFVLYNKSIEKQTRYHSKILLTQNITSAIRIAESLPIEAQLNAKLKVIDHILCDINERLLEVDTHGKQ